MTHDDLLAIRDANLAQIERLAGLLEKPDLAPSERRLVLSIKQARIIETGAIERFLQIEQTIVPRHKRPRPMSWC